MDTVNRSIAFLGPAIAIAWPPAATMRPSKSGKPCSVKRLRPAHHAHLLTGRNLGLAPDVPLHVRIPPPSRWLYINVHCRLTHPTLSDIAHSQHSGNDAVASKDCGLLTTLTY